MRSGRSLRPLLKVAGLSLASLAASFGGPPEARGGTSPDATLFVFLSRSGGLVGGMSARAGSRYLNAAGLAQVSQETTDGGLLSLCEGRTPGVLANVVETLPAAMPKKGKEEDSGLVSDYHPPHVSIVYSLAGRGYFAEDFDPGSLGGGLAPFVQRLETAAEKTARSPARPGLYARAQRLPRFDPNIEKLDARLPLERFRSIPRLVKLIENEMSLVFLGEGEGPEVLFEGAAVAPGKPLHLKIGERYYVVIAYRLGAGQGGAAPCS